MSDSLEGLLSGVLGKTPLAGLGITPKLQQRDIIIELTAEQFKNAVLSGLREDQKRAISVEFHEGKMTIRIRLW